MTTNIPFHYDDPQDDAAPAVPHRHRAPGPDLTEGRPPRPAPPRPRTTRDQRAWERRNLRRGFAQDLHALGQGIGLIIGGLLLFAAAAALIYLTVQLWGVFVTRTNIGWHLVKALISVPVMTVTYTLAMAIFRRAGGGGALTPSGPEV